MAGKRNLFTTKENLEELYNKYKSAYKIADMFNVNYKTVYGLMKHYGIESTSGSQGARKHFFNEEYFKVIDTPEKKYWLGFIMADGGVYRGTDEYSHRLQINLKGSDIGHLDKFQKVIGSDYKISEKLYRGSPVAILKINSTIMCNDLINLGATIRKSLVCNYPNIDSDRDFIRGYFDGDGCIKCSKLGKWNFNIVGGASMLESIQSKLPVKTYLYKVRHSETISLETAKHEDISKLYEWLYNDSEIYLDRKREKYSEFHSNYILSPSGAILSIKTCELPEPT